jgi:hypothetical protein
LIGGVCDQRRTTDRRDAAGIADVVRNAVRTLSQPVWQFFRRRTRTADVAEELSQDTFVAVLEGAGRYEQRGIFRSYLFALESVAWALLSLLRAGPFLLLWTVVLASAWLGLRRALGSRMRDSR